MHDSASTLIEGFTIRSGRADGREAFGAGLIIDASDTLVRRCRVQANEAPIGAGTYVALEEAAPIFDACRFENNSAWYGGGAEIGPTATPTLVNCLFDGNRAVNVSARPAGGAVEAYGVTAPTFVNCTFFDNSSVEFGGAFNVAHNADLQLSNCVLWRDSAPDGAEIHIGWPGSASATVTVSYSDVEGGEAGVSIATGSTLDWGAGNINLDPLFGDPANRDYHVSAGTAPPVASLFCNFAASGPITNMPSGGCQSLAPCAPSISSPKTWIETSRLPTKTQKCWQL